MPASVLGRVPRIAGALGSHLRNAALVCRHALRAVSMVARVLTPRCVLSGVRARGARRCVLELFTFLKMGGDPRRVNLEPIEAFSEQGFDRSLSVNIFDRFDAAQANCFKPCARHTRPHCSRSTF